MFSGLQNYVTMANDAWFWRALWFTTLCTLLVTPPIFILAFILALLVNQSLHGINLFRTAYFLP